MGPPPHQVIGEVEDDVPAAAVRRPLRPPHARTRRARNKIQAKEVRVSELGHGNVSPFGTLDGQALNRSVKRSL